MGWLTGWTYRKKITIDETKVDADLTNFPVLVKLTSTNFDFSKARSDGYDIRFTSSDGTTLLKYERERHQMYEYKKPTAFSDPNSRWTDESKAYDGDPGDESTYAYSTAGSADQDPWLVFNTWQSKGGDYTATTLYVKWKTNGTYSDDKFAIRYTKDGGTNWYDLVPLAVHNETSIQTSSVSLDSNQNLANVQVKLVYDRIAGADTGITYIYDIWTRGTLDPASFCAEYWVKIPSVSGSANTEFYIYYGKSDATDGADPTNVWDSDFKGVWHLKETGSATRLDSTANANNGTPYNGVAGVEGKIDGANDFERDSSQYITIARSASLEPTRITMEAWVKAETLVSWERVFNKGIVGTYQGYSFLVGETNFLVQLYIGTSLQQKQTAHGMSTGTFYYIAATYDGSAIRVYKDGSLLQEWTGLSGNLIHNTSEPLYLGRHPSAGEYLDAVADECRISSVARTGPWIKASYHSGNDSLVSYGSEETAYYGRTLGFIIG